MKKQHHLFLKQDINETTSKHYYFRYTSSEFECEEYEIENEVVKNLKYYNSDKEFFNLILNSEKTIGSSPVVYFGKKNTKWTAFGELIEV